MNLKLISVLVLVFFISCRVNYAQQHYWIKNVNIIDVENGDILKNHSIEIEQGKIKTILHLPNKISGEIIDGEGKYVIPGLWDMHVHLTMVGDATMPLFLNYGITGVRDMGGDMELIKKYKTNHLNPVIYSAGAILESPRFYQIISMLLGEEFTKTRVSYENPEQARSLVDSLIASGSDFIKIRTALNDTNFLALGKACKERGVAFAGHIDPNINLLIAVKSGLSSIEHSEFFHILEMDETQQKELAQAISAEKTFYTPTLIAEIKNKKIPKSEVVAFFNDSLNQSFTERAFISSKLLEYWKLQEEMAQLEAPMDWNDILPAFFKFGNHLAHSGVPLLAGTDCGLHLVIPGQSLHEELELMVKHLNISNLSALQSATINPAKFFKNENEGKVKAGASANLLLLDENPLENITNTQKIAVVIKEGKIYSKEKRAELMAKVQADVNKERSNYENKLIENFRENLKKLMNSQE
jgi:hypothetical protein